MQQARTVAEFVGLRALCTRAGPIGPARSKSKMMPAPNMPITPIANTAERQDVTAANPAVIDGSVIFPRSPAKL